MSRRPAPAVRLSGRDLAVLGDVGRYRFLSGDHVRRLHFAEGTTVGRQRRAQAALRRLHGDGYLCRLPRRVGGHGSGSGRFVYQLGFRGQRVVWPHRAARSPGEVGALFVDHASAIAEIAVELTEALRAHDIDALQLEPEPTCWRSYLGIAGQSLVLKPDLLVSIGTSGQRLVWFVEVDRATEGLRRIRTKAMQYLTYWRTGLEQERPEMGGVFPRVLWSVPDETRASAIRRTLAELPDPAVAMFAVATNEDTGRALLGRTTNEGGES